MYTTVFTTEIANQHIQELHREAGGRRVARLSPLSTRTQRARTARNDLSRPTMNRWHVTPAH
jgi:hypothetical protein